jgi:hypothetical protein
MSHVTLEASWCTIDIDTEAGKVVVIERWQYVWNVASARVPRWTLAEKRAFHARAEREIWNAWSNVTVHGPRKCSRLLHKYFPLSIPARTGDVTPRRARLAG